MRFGTPHPMPGHVIVTGATGFIGSHLSTRLLGEGCRLTIVTRHPDSPSARWLASRGARVVTADLTDADALLRAADDEPCDALIHLGASVNLAGDDMRATNVAGTANVLRLAEASRAGLAQRPEPTGTRRGGPRDRPARLRDGGQP